MEFHRNPQVETELLGRLQLKYLTDKPHPHLTELIGCLTRAWYDRFQPLLPTRQEMLYFAVGFGLEEVLLRDEGTVAPQSVQMSGIWLTPDYIELQGGGVDLKSTRMSATPDGTPKQGWPESWLRQFQAYARSMERLDYSVAIVYLLQPELVAGTFIFTNSEVEANWNYIQARALLYEGFVRKAKVPLPYAWNQEWECRSCRYAIRCKGKEA